MYTEDVTVFSHASPSGSIEVAETCISLTYVIIARQYTECQSNKLGLNVQNCN